MRAAHFALCLVLAIPVVVAWPAPIAESWGTPDWTTVTGTGIAPACETTNCFVVAAVPAGASDFTRYRHGLATPVSISPTFSFRFLPPAGGGQTDALIQIGLDNQTHLHVELTESAGNNMVALHTTGNPQMFAGSWSSAGWYTARVGINASAQTANLTLLGPSGAIVGFAGPTPLAPDGRIISFLSYVDVQARNWGGGVQSFRFDDFTDGRGFSETFSRVPFPWSVEGPGGLARTDCLVGRPLCSLEVTSYCCDAWTRVTRVVTTTVGTPFRTNFEFLPPSTNYANIDAVVQLRLDHGDLNIELTGGTSNREISILSSTGVRATAGSWEPGQWEHVLVDVDPTLHTATLWLDDALLPAVTLLYLDAKSLREVSFQGVRWGSASSSGVFHYDNLEIVPLE